jgi:hypothetical protein
VSSLVDAGATVLCEHAGQAQPVTTSQRVSLGGQPAVTLDAAWTVSGCSLPPPPTANGPCVTAQWLTGATRVTADRMPVLVEDGQAVCAPTGTGLEVLVTQTRVRAT